MKLRVLVGVLALSIAVLLARGWYLLSSLPQQPVQVAADANPELLPSPAMVYATYTVRARGTQHAVNASIDGDRSALTRGVSWGKCFPPEIGPRVRLGVASADAQGVTLTWSSQRAWGADASVIVVRRRAILPSESIRGGALKEALKSDRARVFVADRAVRHYSRPHEGYVSPAVHTASLHGLRADTEYVYAIAMASDVWGSCWSPPSTFRTAPAGGGAAPLTIGVVADMGVSRAANRVARQLAAAIERDTSPLRLIVHAGDISYAHWWDGRWPLHTHLHGREAKWDEWELLTHPLSSRVPYAAAAGGHDVLRVDSFVTRFPTEPRLWHSFDYGPFHIACIFAEDPAQLSPGSEQARWLAADLSAYAWGSGGRTARPWLVVVGHTPLYTGCNQNATELRRNLEPLLMRFRVDFMVAGHQHVHERTFPVVDGRAARREYSDPLGTVHINCGTGGGKLYAAESECSDERRARVPLIAHSEGAWGHCELSALNHTHVHFRFVDDYGVSSARRQFILERPAHQAAAPPPLPTAVSATLSSRLPSLVNGSSNASAAPIESRSSL